MNVLVTGGAGYIGSHAVKRLLADGHRVVVIDNLVMGHRAALERLTPRAEGRLAFVQGDVADFSLVERVLWEHKVDAVMHFAALAAVGESVVKPLAYYHANVTGMESLLRAVEKHAVPRFVFSSSCATYGQPADDQVPVRETCPQHPISPYGRTKLVNEWQLRDFADSRRRAGKDFAFVALRYFNVAGADPEGLIGEDHTPESHIVPLVIQAALGQRPHVEIFGTDYPTPDGTCVRDYVHVTDLVDAHALALDRLKPGDEMFLNVGIGAGISVRQIIESVKRVSGRTIVVKEGPRRPGDPAALYNDPSRIRQTLGWTARHATIDDIVKTAWAWFQKHPRGYAS